MSLSSIVPLEFSDNLKFYKYQALGNDFIIVDCLKQKIKTDSIGAKKLCDRKFGIGADGVLYLLPSKIADFRLKIINADGSEAEMCGNGIRCLAKHLYDYKYVKKKKLSIETLAGKIQTESFFRKGKFHKVKVNMGASIFERNKIPMLGEGEDTDEVIEINNEKFCGIGVSVGNPHFVIFENEVRDIDAIRKIGAVIESHKIFPNRTNVEFAQLISNREARVVVYERGCGITLACGTGACAVAVAGVIKEKLKADAPITVHLLGGDLEIIVSRNLKSIEMIGSAERVYEGKANEKF